jgi:hypothetical protein
VSSTGTVPGTNGDFDWENITGKTSSAGKAQDRITITFVPKNPPTTCNDIRLVQTVKYVAFNNGAIITTDPKKMYNPPFDKKFSGAHRKIDEIIHLGQTYAIDYLKCNSEPFYNGDSALKPSKGDATTTPPTGTKMSDGPTSPVAGAGTAIKANIKRVVKEFETCAICIPTGKILGCMKWSSTGKRSTKDWGTITVTPTGSNTESAAFKKALKRFTKSHTSGAGGNRHWWCPQTHKIGKDKTGKTLPPLTTPFDTLWAMVKPSFHVIDPDEQYIGKGRLVDTPSEIFAQILENPLLSGIKFTWAGETDKTISGVVFSPIKEITSREVSPFIYDEQHYVSDFVSLFAIEASSALILSFVKELNQHQEHLTQSDGPVRIILMTNLGSENAIGYAGALTPETLQLIIDNIQTTTDLNDEEYETLSYLSLNMGTKEEV